jgi:hypothetical protein
MACRLPVPMRDGFTPETYFSAQTASQSMQGYAPCLQNRLRDSVNRVRSSSKLRVAWRLLQPATSPAGPTARVKKQVQNAHAYTNQADRGQSEPLIQKNRSVRILAKSIFRELKTQGYDDKQIVALATELLSEVTDDMSRESARPRPTARRV